MTGPPDAALPPDAGELERFFDLSPDLLCIAGFDGVFRRLNPAWERTLGFTVAELCSRPFIEFVHPADRVATIAESGKLRSGADTVWFENRYRCKDGSYRWLVWCSSMSLENRLFYAAARDISELKRTQEELLLAKEAAEAASRAKSDFLGQMSHELRTPLNSILGFTQLLRKSPAGNRTPEDLLFLSRIAENGERLLRLIGELLDLTKIEARRLDLELAPADVRALVADVAAEFQGTLEGRELRIVTELPGAPAPLVTDAARLRQILLNLVANAVKFTEKGTVTIRVRVDEETGLPAAIEVADTGIGIPKERQAAVFEAFEQADRGTSRRYGGTGLGLAIARSLSELLGYRLALASEPGKGSTFTIHLTGG